MRLATSLGAEEFLQGLETGLRHDGGNRRTRKLTRDSYNSPSATVINPPCELGDCAVQVAERPAAGMISPDTFRH
jgi:hypothetical protein